MQVIPWLRRRLIYRLVATRWFAALLLVQGATALLLRYALPEPEPEPYGGAGDLVAGGVMVLGIGFYWLFFSFCLVVAVFVNRRHR